MTTMLKNAMNEASTSLQNWMRTDLLNKVNEVMTEYLKQFGIELIDFKLEYGRCNGDISNRSDRICVYFVRQRDIY